MLTLYHGDTSVCASKVRLTLFEKHLQWDGKLLDLNRGDQFRPEYLRLNPQAVVPTLVHDEIVVTESTIINEYLDESFPENPLRPESAADRARMRLWTHRENSIHDATNTVTTAIFFRMVEMAKPEAERQARIDGMPDPSRRKKWRELIELGSSSELVMDALVRFAQLFSDMEAALKNHRWLVGQVYTLADIGLLSYLYRLKMLQMDQIWLDHYPFVSGWFERSCSRPSFVFAISNFVPEAKRIQYSLASSIESARVTNLFCHALKRI